MLVGDAIIAAREAMTDLPPTIAAPPSFTASVGSFGPVSLAPGQYYVVLTFRTPWGETLPSAEQGPITVSAGQGIQIATLPWTGVVTAFRAYFTQAGGAAGSENQYVESQASLFVIGTTLLPIQFAYPPTRNTAYNPDQDGDAVSAATMFRWFNDGLKLASQVCGGLPDYGGVGTVTNAPQYVVPGQWRKISSCWYDGYPLAMDDAGNFFRRNPITASVLASVALSTFNNQMLFEVWPQPARTAAQTVLAQQLQSTDTQAVLINSGGFLLTNGYVQIGSEIMSYAGNVNNTLQNLQRALSGTMAAYAAAGTQATELNLFWQGWRAYNPAFVPGNSNVVVPTPVAWESVLFEYLLSRMKLAEQNVSDYSKLNDSFKKNISDWFRSTRAVVGPRQIGDPSNALEVWPNFGGGFVIP